MPTSVLTRVTAVVGLLFIVATVISAQTPTGQPSAGIPELLAEVRALRAEVNRAAGASMRMQLLLARLTLQEQRITSLGRQTAEVQEQLVKASRERTGTQAELGRIQDVLGGQNPAFGAEDERRQLGVMVRVLSEQLAQQTTHEQQLRARETEFLAAIAAEQARWADFNARLDELERALPTTTGR